MADAADHLMNEAADLLEERRLERDGAKQNAADLLAALTEEQLRSMALLAALKELDEAGRTAWHFQSQDTNAQQCFASALQRARAAIARAEA